MTWKFGAKELEYSLRHTNEAIGPYVTGEARMHFYRYLNWLGRNAKYCDTDSAIYIQRKRAAQMIEAGDKWENDLRVPPLREHFEIYV